MGDMIATLSAFDSIEAMPTIPVVLGPLLRYFEQPIDTLEVQQVVELISQDKSLAAQCLQMANSPLFGRWQSVDSIRGAVVALGMQRMRDIALSCSLLKLTPNGSTELNPVVFWEHSLGCALVARMFARKMGFDDPGKTYLAALLHDIGIVAELWVMPYKFQEAYSYGRERGCALCVAEREMLGFTHSDVGKIVAQRWRLGEDLVEVLSCHHAPDGAREYRALVAIVALSDLFCRMCSLGHGYVENTQINFLEEPSFSMLSQECPSVARLDWARFTFELESYMEEVHRLVAALYGARG